MVLLNSVLSNVFALNYKNMVVYDCYLVYLPSPWSYFCSNSCFIWIHIYSAWRKIIKNHKVTSNFSIAAFWYISLFEKNNESKIIYYLSWAYENSRKMFFIANIDLGFHDCLFIHRILFLVGPETLWTKEELYLVRYAVFLSYAPVLCCKIAAM